VVFAKLEPVIPTEAGIQTSSKELDSHFGGNEVN